LRFTLPRQRGGKEGEAPIPGAGIEPAQYHGTVSIIPGAFIPPGECFVRQKIPMDSGL
jgi:hypothetical protein